MMLVACNFRVMLLIFNSRGWISDTDNGDKFDYYLYVGNSFFTNSPVDFWDSGLTYIVGIREEGFSNGFITNEIGGVLTSIFAF